MDDANLGRRRLDPVGGWERVDWIAPLAIFAAIVLAKLLFVTSSASGPAIIDEIAYFNYATEMSQGTMYLGSHYPPMYPISLIPAFLFGEPYRVALILNAIYSSLMAFPVYAIARLVMGRKMSVATAVLAALLPYHYVLPRFLMSENIYFPLVMTAVFMVLWRPQRRVWIWDASTGVVFAVLYLTRYVSLPLIPVFLIVWWMREVQISGRFLLDARSRWRFVLMLFCFGAAFAPWVLLQLFRDQSLALALGFGITSRTDPAQHTLVRLWVFVRMYLAYFVLLAAPVLGLVLFAFRETWRDRAINAYTRTVAALGLVALSLLVALSRHSWRANYNYPDPYRIMGRYTIYLAPLFLIVALATLVRLMKTRQDTSRLSWGHCIWGLVVPLAMIFFSYFAVLGNYAMPFSSASITDRGSIDAYRIILLGHWFWPLVAGSLCLGLVGIYLGRRGARTAAILVVTLGVAVYSLAGIPKYFDQMERHAASSDQMNAIIGYFYETGAEPTYVLISEEAVDASRMISKSASVTWRMLCNDRDLVIKLEGGSAWPLESGETADDLPDELFDLEVRLAAAEPASSVILDEWEIDGIRYVLVSR